MSPMHTKRTIHSHKESPEQKKQKVNHPSGTQLPAAFWNNLSVVWLTRNALRELDRKNNQATASVPQQTQLLRPTTISRNELRAIQRFARQGGPDLSDLRGYLEPTMNSSTPSSNKSSTTKSSGPYDRNFQQHLTDHGIFPPRHRFVDGHMASKPGNWDDILQRLTQPRPSLSSASFTAENFEEFLQADADASKEKQVMETVIPFIEGKVTNGVGGGIPFRNLDHLTDGTLVPGNPDRYYGACSEQLNHRIQNELNGQIIPSTQHDLPIAPNFFLAVKGPDGSASVARKQACYDGALGARGIHSLQEYGKDNPDFDNNAYTLTSTYHYGQLQMFTSHPSKSINSDQPEYNMTQLGSFSLTHDIETFRQGASWYRNGKDWAKEQRDDAIRRANEQAARSHVESATVNTIEL